MQEEFDKSDILRGLPISLARVDYHAEWVSTAILRLMDNIPDVEGGTVVRDSRGKPTGIFVRVKADFFFSWRLNLTKSQFRLIMPFHFLLPFGRPGLTSIENGSSILWYRML